MNISMHGNNSGKKSVLILTKQIHQPELYVNKIGLIILLWLRVLLGDSILNKK